MHQPALELYVDAFLVSPFVFSCAVALVEKGIHFEATPIALHLGEQRTPTHRERSLTGKVPCLRHHDFWLSESLAIVEYLEESFPPPSFAPVLPLQARDRARARQLLSWMRSDLLALRRERPSHGIFHSFAHDPLSPAAQADADKLISAASRLLQPGSPHVLGSWCIADADLALMLQRLLTAGDEVPKPLAAYASEQWSRPSVAQFVEQYRPPYVPY